MTSFMNRMVSLEAWDVGAIVVWLLVVVVIVAFCVVVYRFLAHSRTRADHGMRGAGDGGDALDSLERRYATGQIDDQEFERRRETIFAGRERSA